MSHLDDATKTEAATLPRVAPSRLRHTAARLIGRDEALTRLDGFWNDSRINVVVIQAWGGVGKTSLVAEWMARLTAQNCRGARWVFDWTFYSQGTRADGDGDKSISADLFIAEALSFFGDPDPQAGSPWDRGARLAALVAKERGLLVVDGIEPLQHPPGPLAGQISDPALLTLLKGLARQNAGLCVVTTREPLVDMGRVAKITGHEKGRLETYPTAAVLEWQLESLSDEAGAELLHELGVTRAGRRRSRRMTASCLPRHARLEGTP